MARKSFQATQALIISGKQKKYGSLFECTCAPLNRTKQPFRDQATSQIIIDLLALIPPQEEKQPLVLTFLQPGGLLFEFILLNKLLHHGFATSTIILIQKKIDPKAFLSFRTWFKTTTILYFKTMHDYADACRENTTLRCNALIAIDPDRSAEIPQWESSPWRESWLHQNQHICTPVFYTATLFFQAYKELLCHLVRTVTLLDQTSKNTLTIGSQQSGRFGFTLHTPFSYSGTSRLLPFSALAFGIQTSPQNMVIKHPQLESLIQFLQQEVAPIPLLSAEQLPLLAQAFGQIQQAL